MIIVSESGAVVNVYNYDYIETVVTGAQSKLRAIKVNPAVATDITDLADPAATERKRRFIIQLSAQEQATLDFQNLP